MTKEQITRFNLEDAFKALDEIEVPRAKKGIQANKNDLVESFKDFRRSRTDLLMEDYYDIADSDDLEQAKADREAEVAKAKLAKIEKIVDLEAESEEDILPSYVGKMIIQCPQCMTLFYKDEADVVASEEDDKVVNVAEACQHCGNESGYNLIGKVEGVEQPEEAVEEPVEEPVEEESLEDAPAEEVDSMEEVPAEESDMDLEPAEEGNEEESMDLEPVEESVQLHESRLVEAEEDQNKEVAAEENTQETPAETNNKEPKDAEQMIADLKATTDYESFVKLLDQDIKSKAFLQYLQQHYKVGDDAIQTIKAAKVEAAASYSCGQLIPTQANISFKKSLLDVIYGSKLGWGLNIVKDSTSAEAFKDPTIIYAGKYIIDGHHRWSKAYALLGPDAKINCINFPAIEGVNILDMLKATQLAIVAKNPNATLINKVGDDNMLGMGKEEVAKKVAEVIDDKMVQALANKGLGKNKEEVCNKIGDNVQAMSTNNKPLNGAPARDYMPQTDQAEGSVDLMGKAIVDLSEDYTVEAVDKDLQAKLDAHNEYIKFLQEEIEKEEKALEEAKNDFIKDAIQRRLDALKADLDNALPEEVKNEVAQEEAPIEEVEEIAAPEEAVESEAEVSEEEAIIEESKEKEALKEALNESDIDKREKKNFVIYGCDADYKEIAEQEANCFEAEVRKFANAMIKENPEVIYVYVTQIVDGKEVTRDDLEVVRAGYGADMYDYFSNDAETIGYNIYGCNADYQVILDDQVKTLAQVEEAKKEMFKDAEVIYIYVDQLIDGQEIQRDDLEAVRTGFEGAEDSEEEFLAEGSLGIDPKEVDKDISDKEFDQLLNSFSEELVETDKEQALADLEDLDEKAFAEKIGKALIKEGIEVKGVKIKNCALDSSNRLVIESVIKLQDKSVKNLTCICESISYNKQLKSSDIIGMTEGCVSKAFNCSCKNINNENKILIAESLNFIK